MATPSQGLASHHRPSLHPSPAPAAANRHGIAAGPRPHQGTALKVHLASCGRGSHSSHALAAVMGSSPLPRGNARGRSFRPSLALPFARATRLWPTPAACFSRVGPLPVSALRTGLLPRMPCSAKVGADHLRRREHRPVARPRGQIRQQCHRRACRHLARDRRQRWRRPVPQGRQGHVHPRQVTAHVRAFQHPGRQRDRGSFLRTCANVARRGAAGGLRRGRPAR